MDLDLLAGAALRRGGGRTPRLDRQRQQLLGDRRPGSGEPDRQDRRRRRLQRSQYRQCRRPRQRDARHGGERLFHRGSVGQDVVQRPADGREQGGRVSRVPALGRRRGGVVLGQRRHRLRARRRGRPHRGRRQLALPGGALERRLEHRRDLRRWSEPGRRHQRRGGRPVDRDVARDRRGGRREPRLQLHRNDRRGPGAEELALGRRLDLRAVPDAERHRRGPGRPVRQLRPRGRALLRAGSDRDRHHHRGQRPEPLRRPLQHRDRRRDRRLHRRRGEHRRRPGGRRRRDVLAARAVRRRVPDRQRRVPDQRRHGGRRSTCSSPRPCA